MIEKHLLRFSSAFLFLFCGCPVFGGPPSYSETEIARINDSICREADRIYQYEKAYRILKQQTAARQIPRDSYSTHLVYRDERGVRALLYTRFFETCLEITFPDGVDAPSDQTTDMRPLSAAEERLHEVRNKMLGQVSDRNSVYQIKGIKDFEINYIVLPDERGYRLYVISVPAQDTSSRILYGNDFVFFGDDTGQLYAWKKFHHTYSLQSTAGEDASDNRHTHTPGEVFITATDICSFRLYGTDRGQTSFFVRSPGAGKVFEYQAPQNRIVVHGAEYLDH